MNGNTVIGFSTIVIQINSCTKHEQKVTGQHTGLIWNNWSLMHLYSGMLFTLPKFYKFPSKTDHKWMEE